MHPDTCKKQRRRHNTVFLLVAAIALSFVFYQSQIMGGATWDEDIHVEGTSQQLDVAKSWLSGDWNADYTRVDGDRAFYGLVSVLPAYVAKTIAVELNLDSATVYRTTLHLIAFAGYLVATLFAFLTLQKLLPTPRAVLLGAALLLFYPLWLGFGFFNFKDVPTATFVIMSVYAGVSMMRSQSRFEARKYAILLVVATILAGGIKLAALALLIPPWMAATYVLVRNRDLMIVPAAGLASLVGLYVITPVAWASPVEFAFAAVELMTRHAWDSCSLVAGNCIHTFSPQWSAWQYAANWAIAQLPYFIIAGALLGIVASVAEKSAAWIVTLSLVLPLSLIFWRNSTLYDGLRHLLFAIPLLFILAALGWNWLARKIPITAPFIGLAALLQMGFFIWDNVAMFPYNYVYFNMPARMHASHTTYLTDFWGFSLRQAADRATTNEPNSIVLGNPLHLVTPFISAESRSYKLSDQNKLPTGQPVTVVSYVKRTPIPEWCTSAEFIQRQLPLAPHPLKMSFAAECRIR